tara:strand:- start:870 stop:1103 length:234 start_codon:yes stop_codon:yes gene_type:complete
MSLKKEYETNFDKIYNVLEEWYTPEQIDKIWEYLKEFDKKTNMVSYCEECGDEIGGFFLCDECEDEMFPSFSEKEEK